jgi:putative redox protein
MVRAGAAPRYNLAMPKPPVVADLTWERGLVFHAESAGRTMVIDGDSAAGPSPVQALVFSLGGCMAADVVFMLTKGHHAPERLGLHVVAERAQENPHRVLKASLHFTIAGDAPDEAIDRAIALSREKYCSVWHSMRQDIPLAVTWRRNR